jgi:hypothetical protein
VLIVRHAKVPTGEAWPQADLVIWEKISSRCVRLREGIVYIEWPGGWWAHGELLHYATS